MKNIRESYKAVKTGNFTGEQWNTVSTCETIKEVAKKTVCGILYSILGLLGSAVALGTIGTIIEILVN